MNLENIIPLISWHSYSINVNHPLMILGSPANLLVLFFSIGAGLSIQFQKPFIIFNSKRFFISMILWWVILGAISLFCAWWWQ